MQKIAVLSDIHGNFAALEGVIADLQTRQVDCVFNLGDHVSGPLWPKETIQTLMKQDWVQIRGNHDRQLVSQDPGEHGLSDRYAFERLSGAELDWLRALPARVQVHNEFLVFHGTPTNDLVYLMETVEHGRLRLSTPDEIRERLGQTRPGVLLCGHSHTPRVVDLTEDILLVNPGSVGLPAYEADFPEVHIMESGSHHARYALMEYRAGRWRIETIAVPYDYQRAAEQAIKNDRPDWAVGIQTGFMQRQKTG